jgi:hypothetical protein
MPVMLMVLQLVSIQAGAVTITLSGGSQQLLMGLAFVLGYFASQARELLDGISKLALLQGDQSNIASEQRGSDHEDCQPRSIQALVRLTELSANHRG